MAVGNDPLEGISIRVSGLVQGVGFRPFVWTLARETNVRGVVINDSAGVLIEAWARQTQLAGFVRRLSTDAPPLARVDAVKTEPLAGDAPKDFSIGASRGGAVSTGIVPDAGICPACRKEIFDPSNRRFGYAFTNCTHCGPRLSIIEGIPYDRAQTSMRKFPMCDACRAEYESPADRRFHAQPNACPDCGPKIWLEDGSGDLRLENVVEEAARRLRGGETIAIKGIGGFHLACDARSSDAVDRLRARKRRDFKPFAVMVADLIQAAEFADIDTDSIELLQSSTAPVVIAPARVGRLAGGIAPGHDRIGLMLPYTPLHCLIMAAFDAPLVMTSANLSGEPQVTGNDEAREKLAGIADCWLMHDRDIVNRLDDSVILSTTAGPSVLRRARGMAPEPLNAPEGFDHQQRVLALGGDLKSAFALFDGGRMILSQHMGDLEEAATHSDYRKNLALYRQLFDFSPTDIAVDLHQGYHSTRWGQQMVQASEHAPVRLVEVQHHHAHLASCLFENGVALGEDSVGIILDGTGAGTDGTVWGGEILFGGYRDFERAASFLPVPIPGGAQAVREPWRNAIAHLRAAFGEGWQSKTGDGAFAHFLESRPVALIEQMMERGLNTPLSSSAGRLFDAVAAVLGVVMERQAYEGQAGMELEALARPFVDDGVAYDHLAGWGKCPAIAWAPMWAGICEDLNSGVAPGRISARFHGCVAQAVARQAMSVAIGKGCKRIALSGGVMQNSLLAGKIATLLAGAGYEVLSHRRIPANDGGLAVGQAAIAAARASRTADR